MMFKRLFTIGLAVAITLLIVSSAMADLSFIGGNITGITAMNPTQNLQTTAGGPITGTQNLTGGDSMSFATTGMTGIVADNQYLNRATLGSIGKAFAGRQATASDSIATSHAAGLQNAAGSTTIGTSDYATLAGNGGNIRFDSSNPIASLTIGAGLTGFSQNTTHAALATGTSMTQNQSTTALINSPANGGVLSLIATGNAAGIVGFGNTINSLTARDQDFSGNLLGNIGIYNGQMMDSDAVTMQALHEIGTITP